MSDYKILIIDYEPRSIAKIRLPLEGAGYEVVVANDGLTGIAMFNDIKPDLTLVEAMLPKKHGFEVCQELKQTAHGQRAPIAIITSVYKGRKYRTQALHHYGCDAFLEKPISDEQLLETIGGLLDRSAAEPGKAAVRAPAPRAAARTGGPATSEPIASHGTDPDAEAEIADKLDDLFGDGPLAQADTGGFREVDILRFDPARVGRMTHTPPNSATGGRVETRGYGSAAPARIAQPEPQPESRRPRPRAQQAIRQPETGRSRLFWLTLILIVVGALALLFRLGPF